MPPQYKNDKLVRIDVGIAILYLIFKYLCIYAIIVDISISSVPEVYKSTISNASNYTVDLAMSSFLGLFVIKRMIAKYFNVTNKKQTPNQTFIDQLVNVNDGNDKLQRKTIRNCNFDNEIKTC